MMLPECPSPTCRIASRALPVICRVMYRPSQRATGVLEYVHTCSFVDLSNFPGELGDIHESMNPDPKLIHKEFRIGVNT